MIEYIHGDIIRTNCGLIAHQVNCMGKMGSGVALAIKNAFPKVYLNYINYCASEKAENLLGKTLIMPASNQVTHHTHYVANMFAQIDYRGDKRHTNYDALFDCLSCVLKFAKDHNLSIALPYKIGCVRGRGDWNGIVYPMICDIFKNEDRKVFLYDLRGEIKND